MLNAPEVGVSCKIMSDIVNAYKAVPCSWPHLSANVYWLIHRAKTKQLKKKKTNSKVKTPLKSKFPDAGGKARSFVHFDGKNREVTRLPHDSLELTLTTDEVRRALQSVTERKAVWTDVVPGRVIQACAERLTAVFTNISNINL